MDSPIIIQLPKFIDRRGNLSFLESENHIPFKIKRSFWIYDVPGGESRGGHAYKENEEFIIALSGSFDVILHDGEKEMRYHLNRSYYGLYIPKKMWRSMDNFSTNSLALVLSSTPYNENDYIRDFNHFVKIRELSTIQKQQQVDPIINFHNTFNAHLTTVYETSIIEFDKHTHDKGNITVIENGLEIPFDINRVYYLYDIPGGEERGGHAHKDLHQLVIAASGSFDLTIDDGTVKRTITLNRPYQGVYVVPGLWRELHNFSSGSICLVMASELYNENDYIRDYSNFLNFKKNDS